MADNRGSPPIQHPMVDGNGSVTLPWILFFNGIFEGDTGKNWTPVFTDLGETGTPTITGRYYKLTGRLVYFTVTIVPATNTSCVAGTTYIHNFPLTLLESGACHIVAGGAGTNAGMVDATTGRIYPPAWTSVTVPVTLVGLIEAR